MVVVLEVVVVDVPNAASSWSGAAAAAAGSDGASTCIAASGAVGMTSVLALAIVTLVEGQDAPIELDIDTEGTALGTCSSIGDSMCCISAGTSVDEIFDKRDGSKALGEFVFERTLRSCSTFGSNEPTGPGMVAASRFVCFDLVSPGARCDVLRPISEASASVSRVETGPHVCTGTASSMDVVGDEAASIDEGCSVDNPDTGLDMDKEATGESTRAEMVSATPGDPRGASSSIWFGLSVGPCGSTGVTCKDDADISGKEACSASDADDIDLLFVSVALDACGLGVGVDEASRCDMVRLAFSAAYREL